MSHEFRMPSLGADMEAGTLVRWEIAPGAHVRRGEVLALVETEKGIIDIESFEEGVIESLVVQPGTRVPVGTPLALFAGGEERGTEAVHPEVAPQLQPSSPAAVSGAPVSAGSWRASPAARARAAERKVDLAKVKGTGPHGVITLADVEHAKPTVAAQMNLRKAIAASMSRSKREIPHYYLQLTMDFSAPQAWLADFNRERPPPQRLLPAALFIKATARAAGEVPGFNGYFGERGHEAASAVHVGVAIALRGGGLLAPAILEADRKALPEIMQELVEMVARARTGHLRSSEVASATVTLTSLGEEGAEVLFPIIHPPQVAIIGFGSVVQRPWVVDGRIEARPVLGLTLAADHRVTDGRDGARFLASIRDHLSEPGAL